MFDASSRIMAYSGKGVLKNAVEMPGKKIGTLYTRTTDNSEKFSYKYQDGIIPDVMFFWIGSNDYSRSYVPSASFI